MIVQEIMRKAFVVDKSTSLSEAAKVMSSKAIGSLIVMAKGKIEGIITERDLLKNFNKEGEISSIMSKEVITTSPKSSLESALELMRKNKIKRLPVVSKNELVGIITLTDLLAYAEEISDDFFFN
ncbi:CBS domain-containing protein [Candidatus Pacearchaeota archaeon]|nr:CBS domain-containing protein [Candidatus Pacearchaeota archaeon]